MRLSACQLNRYLLHQSFVEGSVKGESLNAGTLCSKLVTRAFIPLTITLFLITLVIKTMDMGLTRAQGQVREFRESTRPCAHHYYGHKHCRKHGHFHKHGLSYAEGVNNIG